MAESVWPSLQKRFPSGQYALLQEVSDAAGFDRSRSADGIAMGLWPSRGLSVEGIEVKSFRSDWLRELKNPKKAENIFKYCDRWWLVTSDDSVAKLEEIPVTWGWLALKGKVLKTMKEAPNLEPVPLTKGFIAAMMKRATQGMVSLGSIQDKLDEAERRGKDGAHTSDKYELSRVKKELEVLQKSVSAFEESSGIMISSYTSSAQKTGDAVKFITEGGLPSILRQLKQIQAGFSNINRKMNEGMLAIAPLLEENNIKQLTNLED